jgi:hypothetical protein
VSRLDAEDLQPRVALADAETAYDEARETMGVLLNLPLAEVGRLEPRGPLRVVTKVVPRARELVDRYRRQMAAGTIAPDELQALVQTLAEVARQHRESVVRHRRAALQLNTSVGMRLLP